MVKNMLEVVFNIFILVIIIVIKGNSFR